MEAIVTGFAGSVLASLVEKVVTLLAKKTNQAMKFDTVDELKELLFKAQLLFKNLRTTETWHCDNAEVFGVFYDIEDLVDDLMVDTSNSSVFQKMKKTFKGKSRSTREKIQDVQKRLEKMISVLELANKTHQQQEQRCQCGAIRIPAPVPDKLLGREEEKEEIIKLLLDDTIRSVNIVGIGGLGKTTLAWHVQSDPRIQENFHHIRWVSVSTEFDVKAVAESILQGSLENEYTFLPVKIRGLFDRMYAGKSVLIVLDGLRDVTNKDWISFSDLFLRTSAGCKVLVTTHNPGIASKTGATPYHLPLMRDEDCRALVIERALNFNSLSNRQRSRLQEIAGAIAEKSKGLPLAASILGLSLPFKCVEDDSVTRSNNDIYHTREFKQEIFPELKLNTADLSSEVKRCLAYCSLFPRNYHFNRDSLVELWMAEGFIPLQDKGSLREIGNAYFNELYWRSIFQPSQLGFVARACKCRKPNSPSNTTKIFCW